MYIRLGQISINNPCGDIKLVFNRIYIRVSKLFSPRPHKIMVPGAEDPHRRCGWHINVVHSRTDALLSLHGYQFNTKQQQLNSHSVVFKAFKKEYKQNVLQ